MAYRPPESAEKLVAWVGSDCHKATAYRLKSGKEVCGECGKPCEVIKISDGPTLRMPSKPKWGMSEGGKRVAGG